jgi:hypothetical protein
MQGRERLNPVLPAPSNDSYAQFSETPGKSGYVSSAVSLNLQAVDY